MRRLALFLTLALLVSLALPAAAESPGDVGSRSEVGDVAFANSGAAAAQVPFLRGLALLHNFEYPDAAEQFRKAAAIRASPWPTGARR
jgi:hypothetical protein